ncbi:hypothetical protein [Halopiger aswanensis]|uniref:KaiC/GvpD/RAD55 family RecA-like ATPase n=1 Tax=Halopiger aswanensis TaxID=148449 RepID=A0A3R7DBD5_9EURY|nr:hypothetical protein [Halopiger aswanensis]RKD93273.1 hypothetical protein ATJ93_2891 [Halopiger aswanensis]
MSVAGSGQFGVDSLPIEGIDSGTSILLTGDDADALEAVFAALVAASEDEQSIVLTTEQRGHAVRRSLNQASAGADAGSRSSVLAREGRGNGDGISIVDDISDLTGLGMEFSSLVATSQQSVDRFRTGIFLCSTICEEIEDARSVYRFLNSNFLTELRRGDGVGICAFDTSADLETDVNSMLTGMETSFTARIDVEKTGRKSATLSVSGLAGTDETLEVSL